MRIKSSVIKRSISLSNVVAQWADNLAEQKGYGTNFSAYLADLIRRDKEKENELQMLLSGQTPKGVSSGLAVASEQIVSVVEEIARQSRRRKKESRPLP